MNYKYYSSEIITSLPLTYIFVFGSNLAGRHGRGAAANALQYFGAEYGEGIGLHGKSYAIPTKTGNLDVIPLNVIHDFIWKFKLHARDNPKFKYVVTKIGCGLAGYKNEDIAPMFTGSPENCMFHKDWKVYLE